MEAIGKKRTISFNPCEKFYGKNTCNLPERMEIPIIIDEKGNITKVIDAYTSYQAKQTELSNEYEDLIELIKAQIEEVNDIETANEVMSHIAGMQHIFDSKLQAGTLLNKRCKKLGLKFDKIKKQYVAA